MREGETVRTRTVRAWVASDTFPRVLKQRFGRLQHRVVGRCAASTGGREHQQARELGRYVAQVFEMRTGCQDVCNRSIVERAGHGTGLYKQKGRRRFHHRPFAVCVSAALKGPPYEPLTPNL